MPIIRYWLVKDASFSYDEATYAELSRHPWYSSYYDDAVFARHPPLAFLLLGAWRLALGGTEASLRGAGLLACLAAIYLVFRAVRARLGPGRAGLAALLAGSSLLAPVYGVQATLYPFAFLAAAIAIDGWAFGNERQERLGLALFALTHLFGFLFLAVRLWKRRASLRPELPMLAVPLLWLLLALAAVLAAANRPGPGLGPWWQPTRAFEFFYQLVVGEASLLLHVAAFAILLLILNPVLLRNAWTPMREGNPWAIGLLLLAVFLFTGPTFLRFGLPLLPIAIVLGLRETSGAKTALVAFLTLIGAIAGAAYLGSGVDPRAQNDVPGIVDWRTATRLALGSNASLIAGPAPPAVAYYLTADAGYKVTDRTQGPDNLTLTRAETGIIVAMAHTPAGYHALSRPGAVFIVPRSDEASTTALEAAALRACGEAGGARLFCGV